MSELIKLDPAAIQKAEWLAERDAMLVNLAEIESVGSDSELTAAGTMQTKASKHLKALDKIRQAVKKPALDFGRQVDAQAKEMGVELTESVARIKKLNGDYATDKANKAEAERRRLAQEAADKAEAARQEPQTTKFGGLEIPVDEPLPEMEPVDMSALSGKVKTGANAMVTVWSFAIIDPQAIPAEFLSVDEKKIREFMNYKTKMGDTPEIAGVVFEKRVDVRSR